MTEPIEFRDTDGGVHGPFLPSGDLEIIVGRAEGCGIRLGDPSVSRQHARITFTRDAWMLEDLGSRHGLSLNGKAIAQGIPVPFRHGDVISCAGIALTVHRAGPRAMGTVTVGEERDSSESAVQVLAPPRRLELLLEATGELFAAVDEPALLDALVAMVLRTGAFDRAMAVRRGEAGTIEVLACEPTGAESMRPVSRTLVERAASGHAVKLSEDASFDSAHSIISGRVTRAVAAPVAVGGAADIVIVADAAGGQSDEPVEVVVAACRVASLARQALRAAAAEADRAKLHEELSTARAVQERLLPERTGRIGAYEWELFNQPGTLVAGDVATILLHEGGGHVLLGDVAGKGAAAGMVMACLQAHFSALVGSGAPLAEAVGGTSEYLCRHGSRHATAVAFAIEDDRITALDAGHGLIVRCSVDKAELVVCDGGPPIAMLTGVPYSEEGLVLSPGDTLVVFTDGMNEQPTADGSLLGLERILQRLRERGPADPVGTLRELLAEHIGSGSPDDDVSILRLRRAAAD